jgi:predicted AAA+ superfamily ATPase
MNKEKVLEILNDWNFWNKDIFEAIERKSYSKKINEYSKSKEIIVLSGVRRCGKSTLLINEISNLVKSGINKKEILFINFEDPRFSNNLNLDLLDEIFDTYKEYINNSSIPYIFLDEIQNLPLWEKWVRTKYELKQANIYITGSSSKLLSKEFGTVLAGRYLNINIYPLSFQEFLSFNNTKISNKLDLINNRIVLKKLFSSFLKDGGFPKVVLNPINLKKQELITYYETIILKDIVARHNLKNFDNVQKVAFYILSNIGKPLNLNQIKKATNISYELVEKYFEYLKDTFLFFEISKYDYSLKKQLNSNKKIYTIDTGFMTHIGFNFSENYGRLLENLVYMELKKRDFEIFYHLENHECDFLIKEGNSITKVIQVTKTMEGEKTKKREFDGLLEAMDLYKLNEGLILTDDEEGEEIIGKKKIIIMPVWKWLLIEDK